MQPLKQPPFPGSYKTKDGVDLDALRRQFHLQYGKDPISIERFLDFLADVAKDKEELVNHGQDCSGGYAPSQGSYSHD